jgi:peroxiredoxin
LGKWGPTGFAGEKACTASILLALRGRQDGGGMLRGEIQMRPIWAVMALLALFGCTKMMGTRQGGPQAGDRLIDVELQTLDGKTARLSDFTRGRVAIVDFSESWCSYCTAEVRALNEIAKAFPPDKVAIVQVDSGEEAKLVEADRAANKTAFPTLLDRDFKAALRYDVRDIPDLFIVGHDGTVLSRIGYSNAATLRRLVEPAVKAMEEASAKAAEKK